MRRVTAILSVVTVMLVAGSLVAQGKPNFAGEWKLMVARGQGEPGVDLTITQSATAMTLAYRDGVKLTYTLDASVSRNMIGRGGGAPTEQVSKALWAGNTIVVTTTTSVGEEKRTFSMEGGYLVVETSAPARTGGAPSITKVAYQPYERGFGG